MTEKLIGAALRDMIISAAAALDANKQIINELNVFPVPDGDTGTNMSLTMRSGAQELQKKSPQTVETVAECAASALLRGARGNSGVILSLLFRGMSKNLKNCPEPASALRFAQAMRDGVDAAYKAVMKPAEGTMLTVSRKATEAALEFARAGTDVELMLVCALEASKDALAETINQNPVLKRAGVIDAGGKGYVVILEAMLASLQGRFVAPTAEPGVSETASKGDFGGVRTEDITFTYCTEFIVERKNRKKSPDLLSAFLQSLGDSLVVVDDEEIIKVHVHTNDPGKALTEALTYGPLLTVKIDNMHEQHSELGEHPRSSHEHEDERPAEPVKRYGAVAVCSGEGMKKLFKELGADGIVSGGQSMNPSTEDILREINRTPAETVFVFPNNKNIIMAAQQCVPLTDKRVVVIGTVTVPQGIAALLNMDEYAEEEELTGIFNDAAQAVSTALVTYAARDSEFDGHSIRAGEYLALLNGSLVGNFTELPQLLAGLYVSLESLSPELISIYYGEDVTEENAKSVLDFFILSFPDADVSLISGGQSVYYYMISVE